MAKFTTCPNCCAEIKVQSKFCNMCGTKISLPSPFRPTHCPNPECDQPLVGEEKFCSTCGAKIETIVTSEEHSQKTLDSNKLTLFDLEGVYTLMNIFPIYEWTIRGGMSIEPKNDSEGESGFELPMELPEDNPIAPGQKRIYVEARGKIELIKTQLQIEITEGYSLLREVEYTGSHLALSWQHEGVEHTWIFKKN